MKIVGLLTLIALIIALIIFTPTLVIWSLNTLFGLVIPYTLKTWFAMLIVCGVLSPTVKINRG